MDEIIRDFDWELGRFVEYRSPLTRKEILSLGSNSSHWNINNSSVIDNQRNENLKNQIKKSNYKAGTEIVVILEMSKSRFQFEVRSTLILINILKITSNFLVFFNYDISRIKIRPLSHRELIKKTFVLARATFVPSFPGFSSASATSSKLLRSIVSRPGPGSQTCLGRRNLCRW